MTSLSEFLDDQIATNTRIAYQAALIKFLSFTYDVYPVGRRVTPEEVQQYDELSERYLNEGRDHAEDLKRFAKWLREKGYAVSSGNNYINTVTTWLSENDIELSKKERKRIKKQQPNVGRAREATFTADTIKRIISHCDARMCAIIMISATSGLRISEVLKLQPGDVDLNHDPVKITIPDRYVKNRRGFTTFISSEAVDCLNAWLRVRDDYVEVSARRGSGLARTGHGALKRVDDTRIFPYSESVIEESYGYTLKRAGLDEKDTDLLLPRYVYRIHGLRKFFLSNASRYNREIAETLANHSGYLTDEYRRHDDKILAEEYKKIEPYLAIQIPEEYRKLDERVREYGDDINHLRTKNERLESEIAEMRRTIETLVNYTRDRGAEIDEWRERERMMREHSRSLEEDYLDEAEAELK
jgi:integrase